MKYLQKIEAKLSMRERKGPGMRDRKGNKFDESKYDAMCDDIEKAAKEFKKLQKQFIADLKTKMQKKHGKVKCPLGSPQTVEGLFWDMLG